MTKYIEQKKWIPGDCHCPVCGEDKFKDLDADIWCDWQPKYCPNCGERIYNYYTEAGCKNGTF